MAIKITDIRNRHEFMTDAEKAAAHDELVAAKVAEYKELYKSDPEKYKKFANFTDADWTAYAERSIRSSNAITNQSYYYSVPGVELDPELAMWVGYTYEEILQMEAGGVLIPEEILAWAHSMQDNDVTSYEVDESESAEVTVDESDDTDLAKLEENAQKMGEKSRQANEQTNVKFAEFETISKKAEEVKREQEASQKDGLKEIQELTDEYAEISERIKKGEQLDDKDKKRYQELNSLLNGKDGELVTDLQTSTAELEDLMNSMNTLDKDIDKNIKLGDDTIDAATKLAEYEKDHKTINVEGNFFLNMATGKTLDELYGAKGQSLARDVFDSGNNLIQFSNTLNTTLMSSEYTALFNFATQFSADANETIDGTREVMGENFNKSTEELNGEESNVETPVDEEAEDKLTMKDLTSLGFGTKKLIEKDIEVREASQKVAEQAEQEVEAHKTEQEELAKEREAVQGEQEDVADDIAGSGSNPEIEEEPNIEEPEDLEDAQETQEDQKAENEDKVDKQTENENKSAEVLDINAAIEASNIEGDTAKERLEKSTEVNKKYDIFNDEAADIFDKTCNVGAAATVFGTGMLVNGATLIATGVPLLPNPFTHLIGAALIAQGTILTTAGTGFFGLGGSLIAIGLKGVDETMLTGDQIDLTDEIIQDSMSQIEQLEGGEGAPGRSAAEQERFDMRKAGASLPDQARHFRKKSSEETLKSAVGIVGTKFVEAKSEQEAKSAEGIAQGIEKRLSGKKEEYDALKEKKEKFDEQQEKINNAVESGNVDNLNIDPAEQFTTFDQQKMTMLGNQLQMFGDMAQAELFKSLEEVDGLREFLADKEEDALRTIDYGEVAQIVGMELFDQSKNNILLITRMLLGLTTIVAGKGAETVGETLDKVVDKADNANEANINKIKNSQQSVENVTMSKALELQPPEETAEGETVEETEEETKEKEEQQPLTKGQSKLKKMQDNGASLSEQAVVFTAMSVKEGAEADAETMATYMIQAESHKEAKTAEFIAKVVEKTMKDKKEEYDELTEKQKKAEEAKKKAKDRAAAAVAKGIEANPSEVKDPEEDFTAEDEQRLNKLGGQLERVGDSAQGRLLKALEKVEGLDEFLADFSEDAIEAMDFGAISEILGMILYEQSAGNIFLIHQMLLGLIAMRAGKEAQESGNILGEAIGKASSTNATNTSKIHQSQAKVEEITMSEALGGSTESAEEDATGTENSEGTEGVEGTPSGDGAEGTPETRATGETSDDVSPSVDDPTSAPEIAPTEASSMQVAAAAVTNTSEQVAAATDQSDADMPSTEASVSPAAVNVAVAKSNSQSVATGTTVADSPDGTTLTSMTANPNGGTPQGSGLTGAAAMVAGFNKAEYVEQAQAKVAGSEEASDAKEEAESGEVDKQEETGQNIVKLISERGGNEKLAQAGTDESKSANEDAKVADKESKAVTKDAKKDEKQLAKEGKNIEKMIQQEQKEVEKLVEESQAAVQEQLQLIAEFESLQEQTDTLNAKVTASNEQQQAPAPQPAAAPAGGAEGAEGGGMVAPAAQPQMQDTSVQQDIVTISTNQSRMGEISERFNFLGVKIDTNRVKMTKKQGSINKKIRKYKKVTDKRIKMEKARQKAEEKKQKRMEKTMAALDIVSNTFSIISAVSTLMQILGANFIGWGSGLVAAGSASLPWGLPLVIMGNAMIATGTTSEAGGISIAGYCAIGIGVCQVAKAGVLLANGYSKEAFMTLATAAISIATSMVGAGGAAAGALQGISAGCQIVGSSAQLAANVQTVQGKEQSAWLGTVSQAAGLVGGLASAGAGLANGVKGFEGVVKVIGATGQVASATAQISTWIKQGNGKDPGKFEEIMGLIGMGLSTVSAVMSLGMQAFGGSGNKDSNEGSDDADPSKKTDPTSADPTDGQGGADGTDGTESSDNKDNKGGKAKGAGKKSKASKKEEKTDKPANEGDKSSTDNGVNPNGGDPTGAAAEIVKAEQAQTSVAESIQQVDDAATQINTQDPNSVSDVKNAANTDGENQGTDPNAGSDNKSTDNTKKDDTKKSEKEPKLSRKERKAQETAEQEKFEEEVKTKNGFTDDVKQQTINGETFEITEDGGFVINGEEVSPGEMHARMQAATQESNAAEQSFNDLEVGGVKEVQGNVFEKQEDGSFKLVKGYDDDMNRQLSEEVFTGAELHETSKMSDEQLAEWQSDIDSIKNPQSADTAQAPKEPKPVVESKQEGENPEPKPKSENPEDETPKQPTGTDNNLQPGEVSEVTVTPTTPENAEVPKSQEAPGELNQLAVEGEQTANQEPQLTPEQKQQQQAQQVAEQAGLKPGKSQTIDGHSFEVTKKGECLIDGQKVNPGEMKDRLTIAKANSDRMQQQLTDCKDGESVFINGQEFVKQASKEGEQPTFKLVKSYDQDFKQETLDAQYSMDKVMEVGNMSQDNTTAWADRQIKNENISKGFTKTSEILGKVGEFASGGMQMAATIEGMLPKDDTTQKRDVLHLSNMKKGKALMRKIKRKQNIAGYNPYR